MNVDLFSTGPQVSTGVTPDDLQKENDVPP